MPLAKLLSKVDRDPSGLISAFAGSSAPVGWLICDGTAVSRSTYSELFSAVTVIKGTVTVTIATPAVFTLTAHALATGSQVYLTTTGALPTGLVANTNYFVVSTGANTFNLATTFANATALTPVVIATSGTQSGVHTFISAPYGIGSSTTFNLPNLSGKIPFSVDSTQTEFNSLGELGGVKSITLSTSQIPVHSHANTLSNNGSLSQGHVHYNEGQGGAMRAAIGATGSDPGSIGYVPSGHISPGPTSIGAYTLVGFGWTTAGRGFNHYTPSYGYVSDRSSDTTIGISNANAGTGSSYNKMNPYIVLNYIIRI